MKTDKKIFELMKNYRKKLLKQRYRLNASIYATARGKSNNEREICQVKKFLRKYCYEHLKRKNRKLKNVSVKTIVTITKGSKKQAREFA